MCCLLPGAVAHVVAMQHGEHTWPRVRRSVPQPAALASPAVTAAAGCATQVLCPRPARTSSQGLRHTGMVSRELSSESAFMALLCGRAGWGGEAVERRAVLGCMAGSHCVQAGSRAAARSSRPCALFRPLPSRLRHAHAPPTTHNISIATSTDRLRVDAFALPTVK